MDRPRSFLRTPSFIVLVITFALFLLYASLQGHQGNAVHLYRTDRYIDVSMAEFGQMVRYRVFEQDFASLPEKHTLQYIPQKNIFYLDTTAPPKTLDLAIDKTLTLPGRVISTERFYDTLFVVDQLSGIYRYQDGQPEVLTQPDLPFYGARDIAVMDGYVFVAGGEAGVFIYVSTTPMATLEMTGFYNTEGTAGALVLATREVKETIQLPGNESVRFVFGEQSATLIRTLFVADGDAGVAVLDVTEPTKPSRRVTISRQGTVHNVHLVDDLLYVSQGLRGWSIVDVRDPEKYVELLARDTKGDVRDIAVNDQVIAVANGNNGLLIYRNHSNPALIPQNPVVFDTPGYVSSVELIRNYAILADGVEGVWVIDLANPEKPVARASAATPGEYTLQQVWANRAQPTGSAEKAKFILSLKDLRNEAIMLLAGMFFLFLFVSVVTLPAYSLRYWLQRLRGQPVMVEGGQIISPRQTRHADQMRAIHVDTASAVAVVSPEQTRWLGPGLGFLQPAERLGRTLDLRPALLISGPNLDEDPFVLTVEGEGAQQFEERQLRRIQTSATTRDGVEIVPNLLVDVRVAGNPGEDGSRYGYSAVNAQLAMQPDVLEYDQTLPAMSPAVGWRELVTNLGTQLWVQYLGKYTLQDLFSPLPDPQNVFPGQVRTGLQRVAWMMQQHLTAVSVPQLDEHGAPVGGLLDSEPYATLLSRGLSVSRLQVINLRFEPAVRLAFEQGWLDSWSVRAQEALQTTIAQQTEAQALAAQAARERFQEIVQRPLQSLQNQPGLSGAPQTNREILISRVQGTLNLSELSPEMRQQLSALQASLEGWTDGP